LGDLLLRSGEKREGEGKGGEGRRGEGRRGKGRGGEGKGHEPPHYLEEVYAYVRCHKNRWKPGHRAMAISAVVGHANSWVVYVSRHVTTLLPVWRLWSFRVIEICIEQ